MLQLLNALSAGHEAGVVVWIIGAVVAVTLACVSTVLVTALFHPRPTTRAAARRIIAMVLEVLSKKGSGR